MARQQTIKRMLELLNEYSGHIYTYSNGKLYIDSKLITSENAVERLKGIIREHGLQFE